jgi:hypothetical protein
VGTSSSCQWAEGRGNFVKFARAPNGDFVKTGVVQDARTDPYLQTDISVRHEIAVNKAHENQRLPFEINIANLFNQHAAVGFQEYPVAGSNNVINPTRPSRLSGDPQTDWGKLMNGYNYVDALNGAGAFAGVQTPLTFYSRYGMPTLFQTARNMRLAIRYIF